MLSITNLTKKYENKTIFENFNLELEEGLVCGIFGANGCGKSTLLNMIAGLDTDFTGDIERDKNLSFVFQNYNESIMPWLTVEQNLKLGQKNYNPQTKCLTPSKGVFITNSKITQLLQLANIEHLRNIKACNLSGGQKQMVCILRAFVNEPKLILMDEPFSAIDYLTSVAMYSKVKELINSQNSPPTLIMVTHDPTEAILISDQVIVFNQSKEILKLDTSKVGYELDPRILEFKKQILDWIVN